MAGGGDPPPQVVQQTSTTAPANPQVTATVNKLLGGVNSAYDAGAPATPNYSTYSPAGATTQNAWAQSATAAGNPDYASSIQAAIKSLGGAAAGNNYGTNDPSYALLRAKAGNDAQVQLNGQANAAGRLGGGIPNVALGEGVTNALAGMDVNQLQNDRAFQLSAQSALPGLFAASQQPSATLGAVGAAEDANQQGILSGNYDLAQRQGNNQTDWLARLSSILQGNAQTSGSTTTGTTTSPGQKETPWWSSLGGIALSAL